MVENQSPAPFERSKPSAQLLIFFGLTCISVFLMGGVLALMQSTGILNIFRLADPVNYVNDSVIRDARNAEIIQDIFLFIVPVTVLSFLITRNKLKYLQFNKVENFKVLILGAVAIIISLPFINFIGALNQQIPLPASLQKLEQDADAIEAAFELHHTLYDLVMNLFVMALVPAVCEELFFRAGLQKILIKLTKNTHIGIWFAAIVFSAIHMQFSGFFPRMLLGGFLGYLFVWSRSIWVDIFAHFMFNGIQVFVAYLQDIKASDKVIDDIFSPTPNYISIIVSTALVVLLLAAIYKLSARKGEEITI